MKSLPMEFEQKVEDLQRGLVSGGDLSPLSSLELLRASELKPRAITWLWRDWLAAGKLHILGGAPGTGKTTIALSIASTLSRGGKWADGTAAPVGKVVIWSAEDSAEDTLVPRLVSCGANLENVALIGEVTESGEKRLFDPVRDMEKLKDAIVNLGGVDLLIVDPIVSALAGNDQKNSEVRRGLQPFVDLGVSVGCAILAVTHFSKNTSGRNPLERITGSLAFGAVARLVWVTAKHENSSDRRVLLKAKSNICNDSGGFEYLLTQSELMHYPGVLATAVTWGTPVEGSTRALLAEFEGEPFGSERKSALLDAVDFLKRILHEGPVKQSLITVEAGRLGISTATLKRAKSELGITAIKLGMSDGWAWSWGKKELNSTEEAHSDGCASSDR